jgi:hypothetical protein
MINTYNIKAYLFYKKGKVEKLPTCYLCDKPAEIICLKCNQMCVKIILLEWVYVQTVMKGD